MCQKSQNLTTSTLDREVFSMNYKEFLTTCLFKDADIVVIQDQNGMIQDIKNYKKIYNKEILSYETDIDNDLVITTLTMEF